MTTQNQTIYIDGNDYHPATLKDLPKGEFFVRKAGAKRVYTRGEYEPAFKMYRCDDHMDISADILLKGSTIVFVGFTY
jgi:hypothetical protein